ncbi:ankyrin repeat-containing [Fusarium albosuccineum]|uniref:Ankyrin repeat-containing n=1 Tax=Fusarium albosuccineum TaxID=1237068 RepID=A0A8H4P9W0_9HYPO|nr:ankyrin repeat-containing [Fusarium albosuccineum]
MRLLNIKTLKLETFLGDVPPYAILSHTWGPGEVALQDLDRDGLDQKPGWIKIVNFCKIVAKHYPQPIDYAWVDTCCIDKTSSAELSEAINAMFRWYQESQCCFAYLEDVKKEEFGPLGDEFEKSRWFTRGWTLQELLAPATVDFFDKDWHFIGTKVELGARISERTNIDPETLQFGDLSAASVCQKMSWASSRQTTRLEDIAYCLLGIFDINMTMLYGEGERAFIRLQEEILKEYDDHTIFAWDSSSVPSAFSSIGAFAPHPSYFTNSSNYKPHPSSGVPAAITNKGIQLGLPLVEQSNNRGQQLGLLSCFSNGSAASAVGIPLVRTSKDSQQYSRTRSAPISLPVRTYNFKPATIFLAKRNGFSPREGAMTFCLVHYWPSVEPVEYYPAASWRHDEATRSVTMTLPRTGPDEIKAAVAFKIPMSGAYFCLTLSLRPHEKYSRLGVSALKQKPEKLDHVSGVSSDTLARFRAQVQVADHYAQAESRVQSARGSYMCDVQVSLSRGPVQGY